MNKEFIPHKTDAGIQELATRQCGLTSALRSVLIQVNGHRTLSELQVQLGNKARERLIELYAAGFIVWIEAGQQLSRVVQ